MQPICSKISSLHLGNAVYEGTMIASSTALWTLSTCPPPHLTLIFFCWLLMLLVSSTRKHNASRFFTQTFAVPLPLCKIKPDCVLSGTIVFFCLNNFWLLFSASNLSWIWSQWFWERCLLTLYRFNPSIYGWWAYIDIHDAISPLM